MNIQTQKVIDVSDWDKTVVETYGRPYSFQQQDGCKERQRVHISVPHKNPYDHAKNQVPEKVNHSTRGVSFEAWLARDPKQTLNAEDWDSPSAIEMWWERNFYPDVEMIANDLHKRGILEAGEYVIDIDW